MRRQTLMCFPVKLKCRFNCFQRVLSGACRNAVPAGHYHSYKTGCGLRLVWVVPMSVRTYEGSGGVHRMNYIQQSLPNLSWISEINKFTQASQGENVKIECSL